METLRRIFLFAILFALSLIVAGCASSTPAPSAPTPVPPTLPPPTATQAPPTSTPLPSPTPGGPVSFVWKITGEPEPFKSPTGLALDKQENLYVFDAATPRISKYNRDGKFVTQWGSFGAGDGQFALSKDPVTGTSANPVGNLACFRHLIDNRQ